MWRTIAAFVGGIFLGGIAVWALQPVPSGGGIVASQSIARVAAPAAPPNPLLGKWKGPYEDCGMTFTPNTWSDFCGGIGTESRRVAGYEIDGSTITVSYPTSDKLDVYHMTGADTVTYDLMGTKATLHRIKQ